MKHFFGILLFVSVVLCGCSHEDSTAKTADTKTKNTVSTAREKRCPDGSVEVWEYGFSEFRFKRPKFDCAKGFWFCTLNGDWHFVGCMDQFGTVYPANPTLTEEGGKLVAYPQKTENVVTILFPYGLVNKPGNNVEDFKVFNVDEEISIGDMKLKKGDYPTKFDRDLIVVNVPFY